MRLIQEDNEDGLHGLKHLLEEGSDVISINGYLCKE